MDEAAFKKFIDEVKAEHFPDCPLTVEELLDRSREGAQHLSTALIFAHVVSALVESDDHVSDEAIRALEEETKLAFQQAVRPMILLLQCDVIDAKSVISFAKSDKRLLPDEARLLVYIIENVRCDGEDSWVLEEGADKRASKDLGIDIDVLANARNELVRAGWLPLKSWMGTAR